jgi:putative ABC transport system ATP-binding protein
MTMGIAFRLSRAVRQYGVGDAAVRALDDVSLEINQGEIVALVGASGSGKSTTLNLLGCLDTPTSGNVEILGQSLAGLNTNRLAAVRRDYIGFVFQSFSLLPRVTALENVALPLAYRGVGAAERRDRAMAALASVGLEQRYSHTPAQLSGGQQQRVAIARALVTEPPVILADEPTGNLDSVRSQEIVELLFGMAQQAGRTLVMVTHDHAIAARAPRRISFADGRIIEDR